ncbi:hypothetical protein [Spirosoma linguale]|uniref:Alkyl hydroperoxide reductase subunit C/ Thiol specific antioxidant domain-containing protein n=1 Tax=Spirosoma linguale (strain ATCC 33905 / DSM 74 / LMG 10896 / Claus 1) TaxID=504472 RepID=D2QMK8_SPILD|nr:hypothetical protein Slin_4440 [Spirosoma linguale DSM 74]
MRLFLYLVLIAFIGVFGIFIYKKNTNITYKNKYPEQQGVNEDKKLNASHSLRQLEFKNQNLPLSRTLICKDMAGKSYQISKLLTNKKLVFCIPDAVCNTCHENTFKQLNDIANVVGIDNIIILVDIHRLRETVVEFKDREKDFTILGINYSELKINIIYVPFLFILSDSFICENLFVSNSFDQILTNNYINEVKIRYFSE